MSSSILFVCSILSHVAGYFFQFSMSRLMTPQEFGAMNSVLSLFAIETVPVSIVGTVIVQYVSHFRARREAGKLRLFVENSFRNMFLTGLGLAGLVWLTRHPVAHFLKLEDPLAITLLAGMVFTAFLFPVGSALIQGMQLFYRLGAMLSAAGLVRLVSGIVLVLAGFGVAGALAATVVSYLAAVFFLIQPVRAILRDSGRLVVEKHTHEILRYSVPATLANLGVMGLLYSDLVLVKHYFPADAAGQFAAAVVLGRGLFFFPGALAMAMFPMVAEAGSLRVDATGILKKCLSVTALASGAGAAGFLAVPGLLIRILFGDQYPEAARILPYYGLAMFALALANVLIMFNLALRKYHFIPMLILAILALYAGLGLCHESFQPVLAVLNAVHWGLMLVLGITTLRLLRRSLPPSPAEGL